MVKLRQYSGGSEAETLNHDTSCSAGTSPDAMKVNGSFKSLVDDFVDKLFVDRNCKNVPSEESPIVNGSTNNVSTNDIPTVNGHGDKISEKEVPSVNGTSLSKMVLNDVGAIPALNKNCDTRPVKELPIVNGKNDKSNGSSLNGSNTQPESDTYSIAHNIDSLCCEEEAFENQHGFIEVVKKKRNKKKKNKKHCKKPSSNLPPGLNAENIKQDSGIDKHEEKTTAACSELKPPSRNFAAVRSLEKSYSSVVINGGSNYSSCTQNVTKFTESKKHFNNNNMPGTCISVNLLSDDLTKSVKDLALSCQENLLSKVEMTDVSAQTEVCNVSSSSQNVCLPADEEVIHEVSQSPSEFEDVGDNSDESSTLAYCESVVSNDSGRGDSEITYDESMPYCCEFPKEKTSQLIGRGGSFKYEIERKSGVKLWVYSHEYDRDLSVVCMTGTGAQIEKAKELIKQRFRHATLRQWLGFNPINPPLSEKYLPILPEGTDFMGVVSCVCDPNFFWVQQYGHPHLYSLEDLERRISNHFNSVPDAPGIDNPTIGSVIVVPGVRDGDNVKWIRGWIINIIPEDEKVVVRYLDHGGDHLVPISNIRPMRHDFFSMPFFAAQCCLYDILPTGGVWSDEARAEFTRLCNSSTCPPIVRVMYKTPDCYYVAMFGYVPEINAQVDIASYLVTKGFGVRPCLPATEFPSELQQ